MSDALAVYRGIALLHAGHPTTLYWCDAAQATPAVRAALNAIQLRDRLAHKLTAGHTGIRKSS